LQALTAGIEKVVTPIKTLFNVLSGIALALMMFLTAADVGLRYIFNSPISGGLELVEYLMAVIVPFALTVTAFDRAHIGVDLIMERFSRKIRAYVGCVTNLMTFVLYALITWQSFLSIGEQYDSGMTSSVLLIPVYPFVASLTAAFALLSLITLLHFLETLTEVFSLWNH
jgi:TRAP-type C4-dicarboxylate transport system permease small subunit